MSVIDLAEGMDAQPDTGLADLAIDVRELTVSYGERPVVFSVDAEFPRGSMTAIVGPNGAGKSTLLKAMLGIVPPLSGQVRFFGRDLARARDRLAYVPQRASIDWDFPTRVIDVVMMGLYGELGLLGRIRGQHRQKAFDCLERVGDDGFCQTADRSAFRRAAATGVSGAGIGSGCGVVLA